MQCSEENVVVIFRLMESATVRAMCRVQIRRENDHVLMREGGHVLRREGGHVLRREIGHVLMR